MRLDHFFAYAGRLRAERSGLRPADAHDAACRVERETTVCRVFSCGSLKSPAWNLALRDSKTRVPRRPQAPFPGGHRSRATPVPIPNTEVKPATADGTVWETAWESRSLPGISGKARAEESARAFFCRWTATWSPRAAVSRRVPSAGPPPREPRTRRAPNDALCGKRRHGRVGRCRGYLGRPEPKSRLGPFLSLDSDLGVPRHASHWFRLDADERAAIVGLVKASLHVRRNVRAQAVKLFSHQVEPCRLQALQ